MELTGTGTAEPVRTIAEAMGLMMVKVEAREYHLEMLRITSYNVCYTKLLRCASSKKKITLHPKEAETKGA